MARVGQGAGIEDVFGAAVPGGEGGGGDKVSVPVPSSQGLVLGRGRGADGDPARPQRRKTPKHGWTQRRRARFLETLKATCNVKEACKVVNMGLSGAYELRKRDPGFAAEWAEALEQGYAELEMLLLRQSIHGSETTETIDDGGGSGRRRTKTVHSYPHAIALRLLFAHKGAVDAFRDEKGIDRPGSDAVREEIQRRIDAVRERTSGRDDCGPGAAGGHSAGGAVGMEAGREGGDGGFPVQQWGDEADRDCHGGEREDGRRAQESRGDWGHGSVTTPLHGEQGVGEKGPDEEGAERERPMGNSRRDEDA
ncbi:MAG: hypothetical protein AB7D33_10395 [Sphingobium sp.]